jgi:hypothetical protein
MWMLFLIGITMSVAAATIPAEVCPTVIGGGALAGIIIGTIVLSILVSFGISQICRCK